MKRLICSLIVSACGIAALLAGLAVDSYLHAQDETLAAREGIFTLANPGHALLALGLAMASGGIIIALYVAWGMAGARGVLGARWFRLAMAQAAGLAAIVAVLFSLSISEAGHDHGDAHAAPAHAHDDIATPPVALAAMPAAHDDAAPHGDGPSEPTHTTAPSRDDPHVTADAPATAAHAHDRPEPSTTTAQAAPPASATSGSHTHAPPVPASADEAACGAQLVEDVRAATSRFEDFAVAEAEGYRNDTPDVKWVQHFGNPAYKRDGVTWDLGRPESLVYVRRLDGTMRLAGALYMAERGATGPQPCGELTHWHTHSGCWDTATKQLAGEPQGGACPAGTVFHESREMIHVWTAHNPAGQIATTVNRPMVLALIQ